MLEKKNIKKGRTNKKYNFLVRKGDKNGKDAEKNMIHKLVT